MKVRLPAEWMQAVDDRILEYLDEESDLVTPKDLDEDDRFPYHYEYLRQRLQLLSEVYRISDRGRRYLYGELDLREEPKPE